jgi:prophage regulatory protein
MGAKANSTVAVGLVTSSSPSDSERFISMKAVCAITSWSRTSIYRLIAQDAFPVPVKLGAQRIAFRESEVRNYVASRARSSLARIEPIAKTVEDQQ